MTLLQAIILGVVQGATEFIPVSSSGHMILIPWLLGWEQPGLLFNVVAHLGTATGVLVYFRDDWLTLIRESIEWIRHRSTKRPPPKLLLLLVVGTLPAAFIGWLLSNQLEQLFNTPIVPSVLLIGTGLILAAGERISEATKNIEDLTTLDSFVIGLGQTLALLPGISRSGTTITAARFRNATRFSAARFSFLLATPVIVGAGILELLDVSVNNVESVPPGLLALGYLSALISGLAVIHWLLGYLRTRSTLIFSIYCACFGMFCTILILTRGA